MSDELKRVVIAVSVVKRAPQPVVERVESYFHLGGDQTLAFAMLEGRGRSSGVDAALPAAQVLKWRDGLCVYLKGYGRREDALKDLGVSEDALESIVP